MKDLISYCCNKLLEEENWWIVNAHEEQKALLKHIDKICALAERDKENKELLKDKIKNFYGERGSHKKSWGNSGIYGERPSLSEVEREKNNQLFEFFSELIAFKEFLPHKDISEIKFTKGHLPDLKLCKEGKVIWVEVKCIRCPKKLEEIIASGELKVISPSLKETKRGLRTKVRYFVKDAFSKFESSNAITKDSRILIVNFRAATWLYCLFPRNKKTIDLREILDDRFFKNLEAKMNLSIETRTYFS